MEYIWFIAAVVAIGLLVFAYKKPDLFKKKVDEVVEDTKDQIREVKAEVKKKTTAKKK